MKEYQDQLSDPFPGSAKVNAMYATTGGEGLRQWTTGTYGHLDPGNLGVALTNIRRDDDALTLDVQLNYWAGDIVQQFTGTRPTREVWGDGVPSWDTGTVYVAGDVTIKGNGGDTKKHKAKLTIARGTKVHFLANTDDTGGGNDTTRSELIVEGELIVEEASGASDGGVTFRSAADTPSNDDWYGIRVRAGGTATLSAATVQDGSRCVQEEEEEGKSLTLTMTNTTLSNCGATVTLDSTTPYVDREITATLDNSDVSMTDPQWQWQRRRSTDGWTNIASATNPAYTPMTEDIGSQLRATVRYQAEDNVYPYAQSAATVPVAGVPDAPVLRARALDGKVTLTTRLGAENGAPITRIETRVYSVQSGKDTTWVVEKGSWKRDTIHPSAVYYRSLFTGGQTTTWSRLTNGVAYTFEVRSVNEVGPSAIASVAATPGQAASSGVAQLPLTASGGDGQVRLAWTPTPGWVVEQYQVQSRVARAGHGWPGWSAVSGGGAVQDTTIVGLLNGTEYEFMARAVNHKEELLAVSNVVLATPAGRPGVPVLTAAGGDGQVALRWRAAAANGSAVVRYEMQGRVAKSGHGWPGWSVVPGGSSARDTTITGLLNGTEYEFAVRAVNRVGAGVAALATATPFVETEDAYRLHTSGTTAPTFTASASTVPTGWFSSRQTPNLHARYEWQIRRTRPTGGPWSNWGNATVVRTYQSPGLPRHFTADTGSPLTPGSIDLDWDSPASGGTPTGYRVEYRFASGSWLAGATPTRTNASLVLSRAGALYQFRVRAQNNAGNSGWVEATGTTSKSVPTETETAFRLHTSGTTAPSFSATASGVPSGWSSSRQTPNPHARYEWEISRTRPAGGSWSHWGSASVVSRYTERRTAFRLHTSGTTAPSFSASSSGVPSGWSSSRQTPNPHARYEWEISRTRPAGESWSNWGSATVISTYTARQTTYRWNTSGTTFPATTIGSNAESLTIRVKRRLAIAPGAPAAPSAASGFIIGTMAGRIGMSARRPNNPS